MENIVLRAPPGVDFPHFRTFHHVWLTDEEFVQLNIVLIDMGCVALHRHYVSSVQAPASAVQASASSSSSSSASLSSLAMPTHQAAYNGVPLEDQCGMGAEPAMLVPSGSDAAATAGLMSPSRWGKAGKVTGDVANSTSGNRYPANLKSLAATPVSGMLSSKMGALSLQGKDSSDLDTDGTGSGTSSTSTSTSSSPLSLGDCTSLSAGLHKAGADAAPPSRPQCCKHGVCFRPGQSENTALDCSMSSSATTATGTTAATTSSSSSLSAASAGAVAGGGGTAAGGGAAGGGGTAAGGAVAGGGGTAAAGAVAGGGTGAGGAVAGGGGGTAAGGAVAGGGGAAGGGVIVPAWLDHAPDHITAAAPLFHPRKLGRQCVGKPFYHCPKSASMITSFYLLPNQTAQMFHNANLQAMFAATSTSAVPPAPPTDQLQVALDALTAEIAAKDACCSMCIDMFQVGILLFLLIVGKPPFGFSDRDPHKVKFLCRQMWLNYLGNDPEVHPLSEWSFAGVDAHGHPVFGTHTVRELVQAEYPGHVDGLLNLMSKLVCCEPASRLTAVEALEHPLLA
jgi:hypothetical protein